jgi:hypothetical protein
MEQDKNKGGAPEGNTNAEKWDLVTTEMFFDDILKHVQTNPKCRSLSEAAIEVGEYEELIPYLTNKYKSVVFKSIKRAKDIVKNRLVQQGLDGNANSTMAIFILKNNHNMTDKQQTDVTTNGKDINTNPVIQFIDTDTDGD